MKPPKRTLPWLLAGLLVSAAACSSSRQRPPHQELAASHPALARAMSYTDTHEVRFGDSTHVVGYLVEFVKLPAGIEDERDFPTGTVLLQDRDFQTIGMITPGHEGLRFDADGNPQHLGVGGRVALVKAIFSRDEEPHFRSILPGLPTHS